MYKQLLHIKKKKIKGNSKHLNHFPNFNLVEIEKSLSLMYGKTLNTIEKPLDIIK